MTHTVRFFAVILGLALIVAATIGLAAWSKTAFFAVALTIMALVLAASLWDVTR